MPRRAHTAVQMGFEEASRRLAIGDIQPLKIVSDVIKKTPKYAQIAASIGEIGIVEPPVVTRDRNDPGKYLLLDGHLRIEALKAGRQLQRQAAIGLRHQMMRDRRRLLFHRIIVDIGGGEIKQPRQRQRHQDRGDAYRDHMQDHDA